jgi:formylglycine-generating enzyme required for sulfatase activity
VHEVCPKPFELGKYEVTQREWRLVMLPLLNPDPSYFKAGGGDGVSWKDARWPTRLLSFFGRHGFKNDQLPVEIGRMRTPSYGG